MTAEKVPEEDPNVGKKPAKVACDSQDVETDTLAQPTRGRKKVFKTRGLEEFH